jgi:hypothetical protein
MLVLAGSASDTRFFADAGDPLVRTSWRIAGLSRSGILEAAWINVVSSAKERTKNPNLVFN